MKERGRKSNQNVKKPLHCRVVHSTQKLPFKKVGQPLNSGCNNLKYPPHLSPQPKNFSPRPPQWTLRFQRHSNGATGIQNTCAQKNRPPGHMCRPRRQSLVHWPRPSPLLVLPRLHFGDTWRTHFLHCSVFPHQGTHTNVLVNRLGHCSGARFNRSSPITAPGFSNISPLRQ